MALDSINVQKQDRTAQRPSHRFLSGLLCRCEALLVFVVVTSEVNKSGDRPLFACCREENVQLVAHVVGESVSKLLGDRHLNQGTSGCIRGH